MLLYGVCHLSLAHADPLSHDARSGAILWGFASGGSVIAGASIVGDSVYWGSGYSNLPVPGFVANNKFYAFTVGGR